jgi:xylulokinase
VPADTVIGVLSPRWQARYGLPPARVVVWTGDNPSSLIGTGLIAEGEVAVSLGTSDTIFGVMRTPRVNPDGEGHVFGAPTGDYMGITVFKNGSLARERVRDDHGLDWAGFSEGLRATPPGNQGRMLIPWFAPEITPDVPTAGAHRVNLDPADMAGNVRAVVEAQVMALANHSRWMGVDIRVIHATGGAAANAEILQVMADVFDADVLRFEVANSACLGAALRAWHADAKASGHPLPWTDVVRDLARPTGTPITPRPDAVAVYRDLRVTYAELEKLSMPRCE